MHELRCAWKVVIFLVSPVINYSLFMITRVSPYSIIAHELTHSFDFKVANFKSANEAYVERTECIKNQYSSYRVKEVEEEFDIPIFNLNGNSTLKEDFADTGAVRVAYEAYKTYEANNKLSPLPIGLNHYTPDQLFWIACAQTFCAFERPSKTRTKVQTLNYSPERFRIIGPFSNSNYFATVFNCSKTSTMVKPDNKKCLLW